MMHNKECHLGVCMCVPLPLSNPNLKLATLCNFFSLKLELGHKGGVIMANVLVTTLVTYVACNAGVGSDLPTHM